MEMAGEAAGGSMDSMEVWEGVDEPGAFAREGAAAGCSVAVSPVATRPGAQCVYGVDVVKGVGCADADAAGAAPPVLCAAAVAGPAFEKSATPLKPAANVKL